MVFKTQILKEIKGLMLRSLDYKVTLEQGIQWENKSLFLAI